MKLRRILAGLWIILLLLAGTCYAENSENPIVANTEYGYLRLNVPSVKKVEYCGRNYIECSYTEHQQIYLPYGIPAVEERGTYYCWFDPSKNEVFKFGKKHYDASKDWFGLRNYKKDFSNETLSIYNVIKNSFPRLCDEVTSNNKLADEKYGSDVDKAFSARASKDYESAYDSFKKAYDNGCQTQAMLAYLADICWVLCEYDSAIDWAGKRVDMATSSNAYINRALYYYFLGKNDLALEDAKWATLKDKDNADCFDIRGSIYYEMGQYDKAIKDFDTAIQMNDKDAHYFYYRGKSYDAVGKKSDAQSDYKKAKKLNPAIIDDKVKFEKERSQALAAKQQRQYQRREKYKEDLKKLNDAVYVHNNAQNFPAKVVFENDDIITTVIGNIKNNESEQFYQEVIPQEVRSNYESGTYQQQYEQLKAQVEAEQAAQLEQQRAAAKANGIKNEGIPLYRAADVQAWNNEYKYKNPDIDNAKYDYNLSKNIYLHFLNRPILLSRVRTADVFNGINETEYIEAVAGYFENVGDRAISFHLRKAVFDAEKYKNLGLEMDKTEAKYWEWRDKIYYGQIDPKGILLGSGYFDVDIMPHTRLPFIIMLQESDLPNGKWTSDMKMKAIDREVHCEAMVGDHIYDCSNMSDKNKNTLNWKGEKYWSYEEVLKIVDDAFANE